ncbi:MAG: hypothetical protein WA001_04770 [Patescibacteria group bacterium]
MSLYFENFDEDVYDNGFIDALDDLIDRTRGNERSHMCERCGFVDTIQLSTFEDERLCKDCFEVMHDEFAQLDREQRDFEQRADEALELGFAIQEALNPVTWKPSTRHFSRMECRNETRYKRYRRIVLAHEDVMMPWGETHVFKTKSFGHGHRNFGRKPRRKHREVLMTCYGN